MPFITQGKTNWKLLLIVALIAAIAASGILWYSKTATETITEEKTGEEKTCQNQCGNGICEEIVCMAIGCPCPETKANCPRDCK
jgi:hypothetical protein